MEMERWCPSARTGRETDIGSSQTSEETQLAEGKKLDGHHRATVEKIFQHPVGHNIQWHDVLSLLEKVGTVTESRKGRYAVTLGTETETLDEPRHHDLDEQQVVDLRRMLEGAGILPDSLENTKNTPR